MAVRMDALNIDHYNPGTFSDKDDIHHNSGRFFSVSEKSELTNRLLSSSCGTMCVFSVFKQFMLQPAME